MTPKQMADLQPGDVIVPIGRTAAQAYTVLANYGNRVTAVRIADVTNPSEWKVVSTVLERAWNR